MGRARLFGLAAAMWLVLFALAFLNGALRELALAPVAGAAALPLSGLTALVLFAVAIGAFVRRVRPGVGDAVAIGLGWLALTLATEAALLAARGRPPGAIADMFAWRTIAGGDLFAILAAFVATAPALLAWRLPR